MYVCVFSGPGWITAAPKYFIGDTVHFYNRRTLEKYPQRTIVKIAEASDKIISLDAPLPSGFKKYDMLISVTRTTNLEIKNSFFGNSNARGVVVSAVNVSIRNNTFANLSLAAIAIFQGVCECVSGCVCE